MERLEYPWKLDESESFVFAVLPTGGPAYRGTHSRLVEFEFFGSFGHAPNGRLILHCTEEVHANKCTNAPSCYGGEKKAQDVKWGEVRDV